MPVQPRSPLQTLNRSAFTIASSAWRTLTDAQRNLWQDYAAQILYSDSLGSSYSPTGHELFVASTIASQDVPPTVPPPTLPEYTLLVEEVAITTGVPAIMLVVLQQTSADSFFSIETSGPISPGITSAAAVRRWRSIPQSQATSNKMLYPMATSPVSITTEYAFLYPSPTVGQTIWFRFTEVWFAPSSATPIVSHQQQTRRVVVIS